MDYEVGLIVRRERKSKFVKLFEKTPPEVMCPHFYELILSNGCPYDCKYCYLKLTFRGKTDPTLFTNKWESVHQELEKITSGVFSTGELADSLALTPPLLEPAIKYFSSQNAKYLLLVTKSTNVDILKTIPPSEQIILSFSVNSEQATRMFENKTPSSLERLYTAKHMIELGWKVRIRLDPIILESGIESYEDICKKIYAINPERVTIGSLRQYPTLKNFARKAPSQNLTKSKDGRMRYSIEERIRTYRKIADWLGSQPALCKETHEMWDLLGWEFEGCNCTV